jgi:hypothetical protein
VADPKSAMIQFVDGMIAQMIPAVSRQIGVKEDELKQQIAHPPLIFSDEISAAYTPVRGGLFAIRLSLPFMAFIYKMTKLWAANLGADTGKGLALPTFTEEETVEWATKLMDAFCEGRIDSAVLPSVSLSKHQLAFAASMATHAERVIVAHEFGHLVIEKFRDGKIPDSHEGKKRRIEGFLRTGKNIAADFLKNNPVIYELAGGAENRGSEEVETAWGDEIAADLLGFQLLDEAEKNDSDRVHNLWAFELFFVTLAMIERYQALRGWDKPALSMHPPTTLRHGLLRIAVKDAWNWDDDSLTVGRYYEGLSNRIIDAIQDRRKKNIVWLDLLREAGKNDRTSWIGSSQEGASVVASRRPSLQITEFTSLLSADQPFRRALIALPDALRAMIERFNLQDGDIRHTCMLALTYERKAQLQDGVQKFAVWGSDMFRDCLKLDPDRDLQENISAWQKEFLRDYAADAD